MGPRTRTHLPQLDLLRGAAIIAVVYLHAYFTPWPEVSRGGQDALHLIHLLAHGAVPLFLFIAAYLQGAGPAESPFTWVRGRWRPVWLPALLWMAATLAYRLVRDGSSGALWRDLALFDISGQFYFIWLLLVFGLALTQGHRIAGRSLWALVALAFAANLATIAWYESHESLSGTFATLAYRNPLAWVFFPVLGYALGRDGLPRLPGRVIVLALGGMALSAAAYAYPGLTRDAWPVSYFGVSVFLFSASAMLVYPALGEAALRLKFAARPLVGLSRYAYPIYLVHLPFAIGFGTERLLGDGANWSNYWALLHANAAVGLFVPLALIRELDKASPWLAARLLGVRNRVQRPRSHHPPKAKPVRTAP